MPVTGTTTSENAFAPAPAGPKVLTPAGTPGGLCFNPQGGRRVGRQFESLAGAATGFRFIGPFEPGERLDYLTFYWCQSADSLPSNIGFDVIKIELRAFNNIDTATAAAFAAGRLLAGENTASPLLHLPFTLLHAHVPIGWIATEVERYVGVALTNGTNNSVLVASMWSAVSRCQ